MVRVLIPADEQEILFEAVSTRVTPLQGLVTHARLTPGLLRQALVACLRFTTGRQAGAMECATGLAT